MQPAKQDRSRETQDRILRATERLLRKEPFDAITVRRIVEQAGTSIGSFYARFRDKNALLPLLYASYEKELGAHLVRLRERLSEAKSLESVAKKIVEHFVDLYGKSPNLSRALYEYVTRLPTAGESKAFAKKRYEQYSFLLDALLGFRTEIKHPDPVRAVELAVYFVVVICRNRLFYPQAPQTRMVRASKIELHAELVRLLVSYLRGQSIGDPL